MKLLRIIGAALLVLVVLAAIGLWTLPADVTWRWFGPRLAPLQLAGVQGTLWAGHADAASVFGYPIGAVDWTLPKMPLLHGDIVAEVTLRSADLNGRGTIERRDGGVTFSGVTLKLPARLAAPVFAIPMLEPLGTIEIDVAHARLLGAWVGEAAGTAYWRDAAVAGAAQAQLGVLEARFASAADGGIAGTVSDTGGPLEASGTFHIALGRYSAQLRLAPRDGNARVAEALQYVGQPQADGSRLLLIEGRQLQSFGP